METIHLEGEKNRYKSGKREKKTNKPILNNQKNISEHHPQLTSWVCPQCVDLGRFWGCAERHPYLYTSMYMYMSVYMYIDIGVYVHLLWVSCSCGILFG